MVKVVALVTFQCCFCQLKFWKVVLKGGFVTSWTPHMPSLVFEQKYLCRKCVLWRTGIPSTQGGPALSRLLSGWRIHQWHRNKPCAHDCWGRGEGKSGQTPLGLPPMRSHWSSSKPLAYRGQSWACRDAVTFAMWRQQELIHKHNELLTPSGSGAFLFWYVFNLGL